MKNTNIIKLAFIVAATIGASKTCYSSTCLMTPVEVKKTIEQRTMQFQERTIPVEATMLRSETDFFVATWVEKNDPAYEIEFQNKSKKTKCTVQVESPFHSFNDNIIYQAQNGKYVLIVQGLASNYGAYVYETATCKLAGGIKDLYPEEESAPVIVEKDTIKVGIKDTTYKLDANCVPRLKK